MTTESVRFPQLNHMNYAEWALHMEAILICGGFWDLITGTKSWRMLQTKKERERLEKGRLSVGQRLF